jgi:site-specific DNA recombinase
VRYSERMTTAIGYIRQSKRRDSEASPESQRDSIAAHCTAQGWELVGFHEDIGVSGWDVDVQRPGLDAVMARVARGGVDVVVVRDLSRLSRRGIREALEIVEELERHGTRLVSVGEPFLQTDSPIAQAIFSLFAAFAKQESDMRSEKVKEAKRHVRLVERRWTGGTVPYGYEVHEGKLRPNEAEATVVREVVAKVLGGASIRSEVRRLNEAGLTPRRAEQWGRTGLMRVLRSVFLAGYQPDGDGVVMDEDGVPVVVHEPMLQPGEYELLQLVVNANVGTAGRGEPSLLGGIARCGVCGHGLHGDRGRLPRYGRYKCNHVGCRGVGVSMPKLDEYVARITALTLAALDPDDPMLDEVVRLYGAELGVVDDGERRELEATMAQLVAALERVDDAYADGTLDPERYKHQVERISTRRAEVTKSLGALERAMPDVSILLDPLIASDGDDPAEVLLGLPTARAVVAAVVESVVVAPVVPGSPRGVFDPERVALSLRTSWTAR